MTAGRERLEAAFAHETATAVDRDGRLVLVTEGFERLTGIDCRPLIGSAGPFPWWGEPARQRAQADFLLSGEAEKLGVRTVSARLRLADGQLVEARLHHEPVYLSGEDRADFHVVVYSVESLQESERDRLLRFEAAVQRISQALAEVGIGRVRAPGSAAWHGNLDQLTPREREVLSLLLEGKRVAEIGGELFISQHTARNHVRSVYTKLGVHSHLELLRRAREGGS